MMWSRHRSHLEKALTPEFRDYAMQTCVMRKRSRGLSTRKAQN